MTVSEDSERPDQPRGPAQPNPRDQASGGSSRPSRRAVDRGGLYWDFDLSLPIAAALLIVLGWYLVVNYERALKDGAVAAFQKTQLEIVRAAARSVSSYATLGLAAGRDPGLIELEVLERFIDPIRLLENGDAWIYAPDHVVFDPSSDFPEHYRGKSMAEIFSLQQHHGASGYERMASDVEKAREGVGAYVWMPAKGPEVAAWTPVRVGGLVWTVGLSTPLKEILRDTGVTMQSRNAMIMMGLMTIGGMGLAVLSTRNIIRRRVAERQLEAANADLETRVRRGVLELAEKSKALYEAELRERLAEKEAEMAFAAGLVESAGNYLHGVGNSLAALEVLFLRLQKVIEASDGYGAAFEAAREAHRMALAARSGAAGAVDGGAGAADRTGELLGLIEDSLLRRTIPRLRESLESMAQVRQRMIATLERERERFDRQGREAQMALPLDLGRLARTLAADRGPALAAAGVDLVADCPGGLFVATNRRRLSDGLGALLDILARPVPEGGPAGGRVTLRVLAGDGQARVVLFDAAPAGPVSRLTARAGGEAWPPELHDFINFLNEHGGRLLAAPPGPGGAVRVEVEIGPAVSGERQTAAIS